MKDVIANASTIPLRAQTMPINDTEKQKEGKQGLHPTRESWLNKSWQVLSSPCAPRIHLVSADDDKIPNTNSTGREVERGPPTLMKPAEAAQTSENATGASLHSSLPACPGSGSRAMVDGWQSLPTRVPKWAHEPGALLSYKTSEPTGSSSLSLRNPLAS